MDDPYSATTTVVHLLLIFTVTEIQQIFGTVVGDGVKIDY